MLGFIFSVGVIIGSFLNVCIYRIPMKKSIAYPPSQCPKCKTNLRAVDLIPLLSYVLNRGKCRYCGERISNQYPMVELLNGLIYIFLYYHFGLTIVFLKYIILSSLLIVISFIDYQHQIIPDGLIFFGFGIGIGFILTRGQDANFIEPILGMLLGGGLFLLIAIVTNGAMGGGDIKLMGMLGLWLGWKSMLLVILLSFVLGAIISIILIGFKIKKRKDYIPFGPFIAIATLITLSYGSNLIRWYLKFFMNQG